MPTLPEQLFESLNNAAAIHALIGKTEDLHLDCKVWPKEEDVQKVIAKAACGFANGDGGVIVFGLVAKAGREKDEPDQIQSAELLADTSKVKPRVQDLIGQLIEPGIAGVRVAEINEPAGTKFGFVTVLVPATDGAPCRSRKDWKFYQRISSGTHPMEYFQIADMFGKRHRPVLDLHLVEGPVEGNGDGRYRAFDLGITNSGRGIAKYPGLRFKNADELPRLMVLQNNEFGLPMRHQVTDWMIFGGGADHVIYPGETLLIAKLHQTGLHINYPMPRFAFGTWSVTVQLSAEGVETKVVETSFRELRITSSW
jgi:hypothetical protein